MNKFGCLVLQMLSEFTEMGRQQPQVITAAMENLLQPQMQIISVACGDRRREASSVLHRTKMC